MKPPRDHRTALLRSVLPTSAALALLVLLVSVPAAGAASGDLAWQRVYNGPNNGSDQFLTAAPAPNGGVYVAGSTLGALNDILVARYDAAGHRRWLRTYNESANDEDLARASAVDPQGSLIVAATVNEVGAAVIKYAPGGQRRWLRIYDDALSDEEVPVDVACDGAGNVYLLGWKHTGASGDDIFLVKYSPAGTRRWARDFSGPGFGGDRPGDMALDGMGNVYVTGSSLGVGTHQDIVTLKYDAAGHRRWARRWDGPADGVDGATAIAMGAPGALYIVGWTVGVSSNQDAVILKYGADGTFKWARTRTSPGAFEEGYDDLAVLGNGDVAAVGWYYGGAGHIFDALLVRLSPGGSTRWARTYNGPQGYSESGHRVSQGPNGALYVTGASENTVSGRDILTLKYSAAGGLRWARTYSSSGNAADYSSALVVRYSGVYVAGQQAAATGGDATLLKYRP